MTIDFLDKALLMLRNESAFSPKDYKRPEFSETERKLLVRAFYKLEKDGFAYSEKTQDNNNNTSHRFYISFGGLLALENSSFFWKNRPYRWNANKQKLKVIWTVTKLIAVVINALIILIFTYLTYYKQT